MIASTIFGGMLGGILKALGVLAGIMGVYSKLGVSYGVNRHSGQDGKTKRERL